MPFMFGPAPVRRTLKFLQSGKLVLKEGIQVFSINYNTAGAHHEGLKDFVFWHVPQIQYKNPKVQVIPFKNMTPSPFIRCFYENGNEMLIDVDGKSKDEIMNHLLKVVGKSASVLEKEAQAAMVKDNPANFGIGCNHGCMCDMEGQLPCPQVVPLPFHMRGKYKYAQD